MDLELDEKVFLITGGTDGLGAALAERLVVDRARVVVCGRNQARVDSMAARFDQLGGDALAISADVTIRADLERMVNVAVERWNRIDGVVNNAGTAAADNFEAITDDQWIADMDLKVMAAVRLIELTLPYLRDSGGSIVNVLSIAAKAPGARSLPSAASRATGMAITKALSQELGPDGVRANAVLIGLVESGQWRRRAEAADKPVSDIYAGLAELVPLGRVGRADEFADLVTFLLSNRSSYVTGSAINLDGGMSPVV